MQDAGLDEEDYDEIKRYVEMKDMLAMEMMLKEKKVAADIRNDILELPALYGGVEILRNNFV